MKKYYYVGLLALMSAQISGSAFAGSDTVTCKTKSNLISFDVGFGKGSIRIKMKDRASGRVSTYTSQVKLMPEYEDTIDPNDNKIIAAIPVGKPTLISSNNQSSAVYRNGKFRCPSRDYTDETFKQVMVLTQRLRDQENQAFDFEVVKGKSVPGLDSESGFITAEFICRHEKASSAGGCWAQDGEEVRYEKQK